MLSNCPYPKPTAKNAGSWESYLYFVWEREAIRIARENGYTAPWTDDPILRDYKFTNVRRKEDRVSIWIINNIIKPYKMREDLWFTLLIARLVNWPPTLKLLLDDLVIPCDPKKFSAYHFSKIIEDFKLKTNKVYSGAYMVYPTKMDIGGNKSESLAKYIIGSAIENADEIRDSIFKGEPSIERVITTLSKCFGISTFIAGQVAADLTYGAYLENASDVCTFAPIGPGSTKGLNYLYDLKPGHIWKQENFNKVLIEAYTRVNEELGITDITLHDIQSTFCEFSKYVRTLKGEGKPKTLYKTESEF